MGDYVIMKEKESVMEEIHLKETHLEHEPIFREDITWNQAVCKVEKVINDVCKEYEKDGHPYYSDVLLRHWRRILKG